MGAFGHFVFRIPDNVSENKQKKKEHGEPSFSKSTQSSWESFLPSASSNHQAPHLVPNVPDIPLLLWMCLTWIIYCCICQRWTANWCNPIFWSLHRESESKNSKRKPFFADVYLEFLSALIFNKSTSTSSSLETTTTSPPWHDLQAQNAIGYFLISDESGVTSGACTEVFPSPCLFFSN